MRKWMMAVCAMAIAAALANVSPALADLTPREQLGKEIFFDRIASPDRQTCADCHGPSVGFTGPNPAINRSGAVYRGAVPTRFGNRKPPSAAYATLSPVFHYDDTEGLFVGGNFWDGRATGDHLGNPAADQALGPFLNPVEQNNPDKRAVLEQIARAPYAPLWEIAWGEPLALDTPAQIDMNYDRVGLAIAAYEGSGEVNQYSSKFDYWLLGMAELTAEEQWGMELFDGPAMCSACHPAPLFTDFTYDNLGTPRNPANPFYDMDQVFLDNGDPINPEGDAWIDPGLGGFLDSQPAGYFTALGLDKDQTVAENLGKHKVPTLRNVGKRPGVAFPKAYMHNGVFKSLLEVVHFYNTRDVGSWPAPEVWQNVNTDELGDLGLTPAEERAIVAFMNTLSDGFVPPVAPRRWATPELAITVANPLRSTTRFGYSLPDEGDVRIDVFDVVGRHVATLVNGWQPPGEHELSLSPWNLASGQYFLRLDIGRQAVSRKITLLR